MPTTPFLPGPDNVGEEYLTLTPGAIGGANRLLGATPFTSGGVTNIPLPASASAAAFKNGVIIPAGTLAAGTGTCVVSVRKRLVGGTFVTVSTTVDLFTLTAMSHGVLRQASGTGLRDISAFAGESFFLTVDNTGGTISTQPTDVMATVRICVLR